MKAAFATAFLAALSTLAAAAPVLQRSEDALARLSPDMQRRVADALVKGGDSLARSIPRSLSTRAGEDTDSALVPIIGVIIIASDGEEVNPYSDDINAAEASEVMGKRDGTTEDIIAVSIIGQVGVDADTGVNPYTEDVNAADETEVLGNVSHKPCLTLIIRLELTPVVTFP
jgi:hypothetical protein